MAIDPALDLVDHYIGEVDKQDLRIRYIIDTHTHADHFSGADGGMVAWRERGGGMETAG